jgi:hypothetical protein
VAYLPVAAGAFLLSAVVSKEEVGMFFFEKKNQKTVTRWPTRPMSKLAAHAKEQKFFGSFFQKRTFLLS